MAGSWAPVVGVLLLLPLLPLASSSMVFKLDGNVYPTGHFYVTMNIGEPAKPYFLDVDTGSNLTWLECNALAKGPCLTCNKVPRPLYRPTRSKLVPCADPLCDALHHDLGTTKNCRDAVHQCDYEIAYLDGSTSLGVLLRDKFSLPTGRAPKDSPFGGPNHYSPGQATLHLDTKSIGTRPVPVVLDSGSTYTYLPGDLHTQLVSTLKASLGKSLKEVPDASLPLCWKGPRPFKSVDDLKKEFNPLVSLKFGSGVTMAIPPENYLVITEHGNACFGILAHQGLDMYLIGDITMQDQLMIYDNEKGRIGWMQSPCDKMPKSKAVIVSRI
ncbi:hypothetical protein C2845_PM17G03750 [Panicum miliaceum]|uniref:Peptidase A1 domain-containing protein n=1 Tax=Panicum miliaceum TaxID=4540 RepID=A0A3L6Q3R7_PANMI|nr:hypothetical protein C2845_PM17G03750 [Panicum miliaceum]